MNDTRRSQLFVLALVASVACCSSAAAQTHGSMNCYRAETASEALTPVDVETLPFGLEAGCTVVAKVRRLCVAATGDVIESGGSPVEPTGDELDAERLCYEIQCPKRAPFALEVEDRFGARVVEVRPDRLLCLPAVTREP